MSSELTGAVSNTQVAMRALLRGLRSNPVLGRIEVTASHMSRYYVQIRVVLIPLLSRLNAIADSLGRVLLTGQLSNCAIGGSQLY